MLLEEIRDDFVEGLTWTLENIIFNKFLSPVIFKPLLRTDFSGSSFLFT